MSDSLTKEEIADVKAATTERLIARARYCKKMARKIRHRQTSNEWYQEAGNCAAELEARGIENAWTV